jgi:hypothetical protein
MTYATRVTVSIFGTLAGLAGIEHGIGEILQGNVAPEGLWILSWPESGEFDILAGEPAMTVVPNFLATGILAILVSLTFLVWATVFVERRHSGLILMLLSVVMLLVGAGFGPPLLGILVGVVGTRIASPLTWWRNNLSPGSRRFLTRLWPWALMASVIVWLALLPGVVLLDWFVGIDDPDLVVPLLTFSAFALFFVTVVAAFGHDVQRRISASPIPAMIE